jgi:SAM-dependent methyltransferase
VTYLQLSPPENSEFPDEWYDFNQAAHFWFAWRLRVLATLLADNNIPIDAELSALEIGCGVGFLRTQIESLTRWTVDGADLNEPALKKATPARGNTMLYDVTSRRETFQSHYDVLVLFDVLEHIKEPVDFFAAALWHLKPGGWLLINVPALSALYSAYDKLVGHYRRYNEDSMLELMRSQGSSLILLDMRYWGFTLAPVAWLRKFALRSTRSPREAVERGFNPPAAWINSAFKGMMLLETALFSHPPLGSSLMVAARRGSV